MRASNKTILIVPAVIVLLLFVVALGKKHITPAVTEGPLATAQVPAMLCFFSSIKTADGYADTYYLKLSIQRGKATGELATLPAEKDAMRGTLVGNIIDQNGETYFDGTYSNMAEGMTNVDERMIKLGDTEAAIGYGETMQNADGSYGYKDKNDLNYSLTIPKVDCAQYESLKAGANA
jgi:hypothetical protein